MASAQHYLYLSARTLLAVRDESSTLLFTGAFDVQNTIGMSGGPDAFVTMLAQYPDDRFVLLVDSVDEEQHLEKIPRLRRRDRQLMLARRIEQRFRDRRFATSIAFEAKGRDNKAARDEPLQVLLTALQGDATLQPWLELLLKARARVHSIVSPVLLATRLIDRIADARSGLLVSIHPGGVRQTLVLEGQTRFSRLAAVAQPVSAQTLAAECSRTIQYLLMSQVISRDLMRSGTFVVWVVCADPQSMAALGAQLQVDNQTQVPVFCCPVSAFGDRPLRAASRELLPILLAQPALPDLCVWFNEALRERSPSGYANRWVRRFDAAALWRKFILGSSAAALAASVMAWLGVELMAQLAPEPITQRDPVVRRETNQRIALQAELARYPSSGSEMRKVVDLEQKVRHRTIDHQTLLSLVSQAVAGDAGIVLTELVWSRAGENFTGDGARGPGQAGAAGAPGMAPAPGMMPAPAAGAPATPFGQAPAAQFPNTPGTMSPTAGSAAQGTVSLRLGGQFARFDSMAQANQRAAALADRLKEQCGCEVKLTKMPFDPAPASGHASSLRSSETRTRAAFLIELSWDQTTGATLVGGPDGRKG